MIRPSIARRGEINCTNDDDPVARSQLLEETTRQGALLRFDLVLLLNNNATSKKTISMRSALLLNIRCRG